MAHSKDALRCPVGKWEAGFSLVELIIVMAVLTVVSGIILTIMFRMTNASTTISNRTEMHSSVRSATEVMQQEIGQAGRISLPDPVTSPATLSAAVAGDGASHSPGITSTVNPLASTTSMFAGELLIFGPDSTNGASQETSQLTAVPSATTITALFQDPHASGAAVTVLGTFASGVIPPGGNVIQAWDAGTSAVVKHTLTGTLTTQGEGSWNNVLKLFGDINSDGNLVYVEYWCKSCDTATQAAPGALYRNVVAWNAANKGSVQSSQILLPDVLCNGIDAVADTCPGTPTPVFAYQTQVVGNDTFVVDVAVTLTVKTAIKDPTTKKYQIETKALLNVSPRNVFEAWQAASAKTPKRIQVMPANILTLAGQATN